MHVRVNSQLLATELRLLSKIVPTKPAIAILSHALLTADDDINLWATDLEVGLRCRCLAQVDEPGSVVLPVRKLLALVEQFEDGDVVISVEKHVITVQCRAFTSRLQALPADDFPMQPEVSGQSGIIAGAALLQLIARTRYAVDATSSKYVLKGALLTLAGQGAIMVATDGMRLALATAGMAGLDARVVVPAKTLDVLVGHMDGDCEVTLGDQHMFFSSAGRLLVSRMIDGEFPKYERIIPHDNGLLLTVDRLTLAAALRRVNIVSEVNRAVYFDVRPGQLSLSSSSVEVGSADEVVSIAYDGVPLKVCINGSYVLDFLNAASGGTVTMALKDERSQVLLMDGENHVAVIMPMRGNW